MKQYIIIFFSFLAMLCLSQLDALNRDFDDCSLLCHKHYMDISQYSVKLSGLSKELINFIPSTGPRCRYGVANGTKMLRNCQNASIYGPYISCTHPNYRIHIKRHLEYCQKNPNCACYWPEYSQEAAQISDFAYLLFKELIETTALSELVENEEKQTNFTSMHSIFWNLHGLTVSLIAKQLHYIDYCVLCKDIENFAVITYEEREAAKIKDKLEDILEALYLNFFSLYNSCYAKHPNAYISQEIRFMKLLVNDITGLEEIALSTDVNSSLLKVQNLNDSEFIIANLQTDNIHEEAFKKKKQTSKKNSSKALSANVSSITIPANANQTSNSVYSPKSNILLEQGTIFNDLLLCKEAVLILTKAIQSNPSNREAYIERALAYFETNQLSLALQDYESAKKLTVVAPFKYASHNLMAMSAIYIPENKIDFSKGLIAGTLSGASVSVVEFIPSTYSSCRGILNGLWAFVCSPNEVSQEMLNAAYGIGEFISNHSTEECFQCVVPELKELSLYWENINDYSRGEKIGYLIGKYGIDIFAPIGILKGVNKVKALKRANTMCTLEACASSKVKQIKIIEESTKRALTRTTLIETAKKGKILVKNSNVQYHIMQKKHAWEKVLKLSGNIEEDFKKVTFLLEEINIYSDKFLRQKVKIADSIFRKEYEISVGKDRIKAIFNEYISGEVFLNDAWVITK